MPGSLAKQFAKHSPDVVLLLLWESPHFRGSFFKKMVEGRGFHSSTSQLSLSRFCL
jgi:hypothetical protein